MNPGYVELHAHSAYSFLDGASTPLELASAAAELGYTAMALTDHDGVWGSMEFACSCKDFGIQAITGAELTVALPESAGLAHLTLLVETQAGYRNLCRLITAAHSHTRDSVQRSAGQPWVSIDVVREHAEGLVCLSGCTREGWVAGSWERGEPALAASLGRELFGIFGPDHLRIELQRPYERRDRTRNRWLEHLAGELEVPCVATGNVHSHNWARTRLQSAFVSIRNGVSLEESEPLRRGNASSALASPGGMAARFTDHPEAVAETVRLAERLRFDLNAELGYRYPGSEDPDADRKLAEVCRALLVDRYNCSPEWTRAEARLEEELRVIRELRLSGFFLLHRELLEMAREVATEVRGTDSARAVLPPGRGRGSSVSSIVCYLAGLSHVDPVEADLFAGRFLNDEVSSLPDIDLDFPRDIREKLILRVHERYGKDHCALVAAIPTYRPRGAVRDIGKALALPAGEIERVARLVGFHGGAGEIEQHVTGAIGAERAKSKRWQELVSLCTEAMGLPRHHSQHPGGMVISTQPLIDICPVVPSATEGRQMVQWDKDSCDDAGFLKIDLLGLGMLSAVERCVEEIEHTRGERIDLSRIPLDDSETFESIQAAETTGVFQIESRAQMQMLPRTLPQDIDDLTVQVALVRPGPIQGGAVHPYIANRKRKREDPSFEPTYEHPLLRPVLHDTLGTIVYQEQVIEVAMALAGFSSSEAESLRRAMSRKRSEEAMRAHHERFISGAKLKGVEEVVAERVWQQIQGFSGFGFPKCHSRSFALLAYQSAWLFVHYRAEATCALLNEQPMGFYPPDSLVHDARRKGIKVVPPDINRSQVLCHVERDRGGLAIRIGLAYIKGVHKEEMEALVAERERAGHYCGIADISSRSGAGRKNLEALAWSGALDSLPLFGARRERAWSVGVTGVAKKGATEKRQLALALEPSATPELEPLTRWGTIIENYRATGINLGEHPMALLRGFLGQAVVRSSVLSRVEDGARVEVAGLVVARQRPETAKGITFMLLEDEVGVINLVVPSSVYEKRRSVVRVAPLVRAAGRLERREGVINVLVSDLEALEQRDSEAEIQRLAPTVPPAGEQGDELTQRRRAREMAIAELRAVAPAGHSFGRRGR